MLCCTHTLRLKVIVVPLVINGLMSVNASQSLRQFTDVAHPSFTFVYNYSVVQAIIGACSIGFIVIITMWGSLTVYPNCAQHYRIVSISVMNGALVKTTAFRLAEW